jgi:SAM-dependent methyltransferase
VCGDLAAPAKRARTEQLGRERLVSTNLDKQTVQAFGDEWTRFDQTMMSKAESESIFNEYFSIFPWIEIAPDAEGFDMGCGSGRWAAFAAPRVGRLHCIDPSDAIDVARRVLADQSNVVFHRASVADNPIPDGSQDFGYSLGVLHHVPDTAEAVRSCARKLKCGAPFLVYLYYSFENRSIWYRLLWRASDLLRRVIHRLPPWAKHAVTDLIAVCAYYPAARAALLLERFDFRVEGLPLAYYRHHSFYTMRTDSRDRFGTPLEQRFSRAQILTMMTAAGLHDVVFSEQAPYWCAVGRKS